MLMSMRVFLNSKGWERMFENGCSMSDPIPGYGTVITGQVGEFYAIKFDAFPSPMWFRVEEFEVYVPFQGAGVDHIRYFIDSSSNYFQYLPLDVQNSIRATEAISCL
jgi:hypothetical protein